VNDHTRFAECSALRLSRVENPWTMETRTLLVPFDRPQPVEAAPVVRVLRLRRWLHAVRRRSQSVQPFGSLAAAARAAVQIHPYQLEPALAMLRRGATRVLIADGVGLGKTIQAGLLLNEMTAAREDARALIVTPAGLCDQWRRELGVHFGLAAAAADAAWLARTARDLPPDVNPWMLPGIQVVSVDLVKRPEVLRPLQDVTWDLLVVDEAHDAAPGTDRRAAVHAIALRSRRVMLLTATPHTGEPEHFDALCRIGAFDPTNDPILMFRRTRSDMHLPLRRRSRLMAIALSDDEIRMHRLLEAYSAAITREAAARQDPRARLAAIVMRKRALSSARRLARSIDRRLALLSGEAAPEHQLRLPLMDEDLDDETADDVLAAPGLADASTEHEWLRSLAEAAHAAAVRESKARFLRRWLARIGEPAIVFTEYRDTLAELAQDLVAQGIHVLEMHGGMSARERSDVQRAFNAHGGLLLATDAAAQGLNLHGQCRAILHYELPWNPLRLEQRAGRVDRIGQSRAVHEIALIANDTAERLVLAPLVRRATRVRASLGPHRGALEAIPESRIAAAVLEGRPLDDDPSAAGAGPSRFVAYADAGLGEDARAEGARLLEHRAAIARDSGGSSAWPDFRHACLVSSARPAAVPAATAVGIVRLLTSEGSTVHAEMKAVAVHPGARSDGRAGWRTRARRPAAEIRSIVTAWLARNESALLKALESEARLRLDDVAERYRSTLDALDRREHAIRTWLSDDARLIVQGGLFDRRALREADERQRTTAALIEESGGRSRAVAANRMLTREIEWCAVLLR
jgi:superfamily II DNA or RNA helicase